MPSFFMSNYWVRIATSFHIVVRDRCLFGGGFSRWKFGVAKTLIHFVLLVSCCSLSCWMMWYDISTAPVIVLIALSHYTYIYFVHVTGLPNRTPKTFSFGHKPNTNRFFRPEPNSFRLRFRKLRKLSWLQICAFSLPFQRIS